MRVLGLLIMAGMATAAPAGAQSFCAQRDTPTIIQPGDPRWLADFNVYPSEVNHATVDITATNPRSGTGSLELTTSGSLFDWAFFKRTEAESWGLLSDVNCLAFEWYRAPYVLPPDAPSSLTAETWQEQTPVMRVLVRDLVGGEWLVSHLVWERWYNTRDVLAPTPTGVWNFESMTSQLFWRHFDGGLTYTNAGCFNSGFINSSQLQTYSLDGWVQNCYSSSAHVFGVMIGVGSMWPGEYQAWLDNVQLAFAGQQGYTLEDNFDFAGPPTVVPEPATVALVATGIAGLGLAGFIRRRRSRS
ncbi:MAG: PEP-CTERM sorting domain-containing protein [Gemmatimonadales bacterium]